MPILLHRHNYLLLGVAANVLAMARQFLASWVSATRNGRTAPARSVTRCAIERLRMSAPWSLSHAERTCRRHPETTFMTPMRHRARAVLAADGCEAALTKLFFFVSRTDHPPGPTN